MKLHRYWIQKHHVAEKQRAELNAKGASFTHETPPKERAATKQAMDANIAELNLAQAKLAELDRKLQHAALVESEESKKSEPTLAFADTISLTVWGGAGEAMAGAGGEIDEHGVLQSNYGPIPGIGGKTLSEAATAIAEYVRQVKGDPDLRVRVEHDRFGVAGNEPPGSSNAKEVTLHAPTVTAIEGETATTVMRLPDGRVVTANATPDVRSAKVDMDLHVGPGKHLDLPPTPAEPPPALPEPVRVHIDAQREQMERQAVEFQRMRAQLEEQRLELEKARSKLRANPFPTPNLAKPIVTVAPEAPVAPAKPPSPTVGKIRLPGIVKDREVEVTHAFRELEAWVAERGEANEKVRLALDRLAEVREEIREHQSRLAAQQAELATPTSKPRGATEGAAGRASQTGGRSPGGYPRSRGARPRRRTRSRPTTRTRRGVHERVARRPRVDPRAGPP